MSYYIYKHLDKNNDILYIGQTINIDRRQKEHTLQSSWATQINRVEYAEVTDGLLMDIYEKYYIDIYSPKYNLKDVECKYSNFFKNMKDLDFKEYSLNSVKVNRVKIKDRNFKKNYELMLSILNGLFKDYEKFGGLFNNENNELIVCGHEFANSEYKIKTNKLITGGRFLIQFDEQNNKIIYGLNKDYYVYCGLEYGDLLWDYIESKFK